MSTARSNGSPAASGAGGIRRTGESMRAASGLILAPGTRGSSRGGSRTSSTSAAAASGRGRAAPSGGPATPSFKAGDQIEVCIAGFKSADKELDMGKLEGAELRRGQRAKVVRLDEEGGAYISVADLKRTIFVSHEELQNFKMARALPMNSSESPADRKAYQALVDRQQAKLVGILKELKHAKRKTSCWAWWVFPTEKEGFSDPDGTRVTSTTAAWLLSNAATVDDWRLVLETICDLVEDNGMRVLPSIDHGRVHWFIKFWSALDASPDWMKDVCQRLGRFDWPPS